VVKKTYRSAPPANASASEPAYRDLATVAEFGTKFEADTVAALASEGGYDVIVRSLTPFVVLGAEAPRGAHLVLASKAEATDVRRYLDENGAQIIDDSPGDRLNWKGAAIALVTLLAFLVIAALAYLVKGG